jgi:monofunctional biosynthetic peptidoglycan transglycosylase
MTKKPRGMAFRIVRAVVILALIVLLFPYVLAPLYRVVDPVSTVMLWRRATGERVERAWVTLAAIAPILPRAVMAAEDARFCMHRGIDFTELRAAIEDADDISEMRGGSTIAQQTAKNLFLWPGRSVIRKALEFPLALWLDFVLGKRRLMEIYLNIAEWGPNGEFGVEAAARQAFGKSARDLTTREAALLAAILPNPAGRSAARPSAGVRRLAGIYQERITRVPAECLRRSASAPSRRDAPIVFGLETVPAVPEGFRLLGARARDQHVEVHMPAGADHQRGVAVGQAAMDQGEQHLIAPFSQLD